MKKTRPWELLRPPRPGPHVSLSPFPAAPPCGHAGSTAPLLRELARLDLVLVCLASVGDPVAHAHDEDAAGFGAAVAGAESLTVGSLAYNLSAATFGNIAGGILIVGVGYWIAYGREAHKHEVEAGKLAE